MLKVRWSGCAARRCPSRPCESIAGASACDPPISTRQTPVTRSITRHPLKHRQCHQHCFPNRSMRIQSPCLCDFYISTYIFIKFTIVHPSRVGRIACSKMDNPDCTECTWRDSSKARRSWSVKRFGISLSARETPQVCHHVSYVSLEFEVVLMVPTCSNSQLLMTSCDEM